jgi:hypothetical protein
MQFFRDMDAIIIIPRRVMVLSLGIEKGLA